MNKANRSNKRYKYVGTSIELLFTKCVLLEQLLLNRISIQRQTVIANIGNPLVKMLSVKLGYKKHHTQGVTMKSDTSIRYYRSNFKGKMYYLIYQGDVYHVYEEC